MLAKSIRETEISKHFLVPRDTGNYLLKCPLLPSAKNEGLFTRELSRLDPTLVPSVEEISETGFLMPLYNGEVLSPLDGEKIEIVLQKYAQLQLKVVAQLSRFNMPDRRLETMKPIFTSWLKADPMNLFGAEVEIARAIEKMDFLIAQISDFNLPNTIDHGDLHFGNILASRDSVRILDWSEASISHPFLSITTLFWNHRGICPSAYLSQWGSYAEQDALQKLYRLVFQISPLFYGYKYFADAQEISGECGDRYLEFSKNLMLEFVRD